MTLFGGHRGEVPSLDPVERILTKLQGVKRQRKGWKAQCPNHDDRTASLSLDEAEDGSPLVNCFAGCAPGEVLAAIGLSWPEVLGGPGNAPPVSTPRPRPPGSCTLKAYADAKKLRIEFLRDLGLRDDTFSGRPALRIPYFGRDGGELTAKLRLTLGRGAGTPFHWPSRTGLVPYGLWRLGDAVQAGYVVLVEGESDCHTLWQAEFPAIGIPGANTWKEAWADYLDGIEKIFVVVEPDRGGEAVTGWLSGSRIRDRVHLVSVAGTGNEGRKDASDLYLANPDGFVAAMHVAMAEAKPWSDADRPVKESEGLSEPEFHSAQTQTRSGAAIDLRFRTAREIGGETPESPIWHVLGYVAAGAITEISGKIKAAGKTTLLTHMARAITVGDHFVERTTTPTRVVYLTEQPSTSFREALRRSGLLDSDDVIVLYWRDAIGIKWPRVVELVVQECKARGAGVVIVDTMPKFAGLRGDAENNAGDADEAMAPLQIAANDGLAVVLARHERKAGGEVGDSGRGSTAFGGGVDIVLSLKRPQGTSRPGVRELSALSRFDETPELLVIELTEEGYVALGDQKAVVQADAQREVLAALPTESEDAFTLDLLVSRSGGASRTTVQRALDTLLGGGAAARIGKGHKGDPYRYHRLDQGPAEPTSSAHAEDGSGQKETAILRRLGGLNGFDLDAQGRYLAEATYGLPPNSTADTARDAEAGPVANAAG